MDMLIPLSFIIGLSVGGYVGYQYCYDKMIKELSNMITDQIEFLKHEIVEDQHYLYFMEDDSFASQGNTLEETAKNYSLNYAGYIGHVKETPLNVPFFIIDGKIERVEE
jgi:hypothetical protein